MAGSINNPGQIQTGQTQPTQQPGRTEQTQAPQKVSTPSLSTSHTSGRPDAADTSAPRRLTPLANIAQPVAGAANHLITQSPTDLDAMLANLSMEVQNVQDETRTAEASARNTEVKETLDERLEQLKNDKAEAQKNDQCATAKFTLASIFTVGLFAVGSAVAKTVNNGQDTGLLKEMTDAKNHLKDITRQIDFIENHPSAAEQQDATDTPRTEPTPAQNNWAREMESMLQESAGQSQQMFEQLDQARQATVAAAVEANEIASMRFTRGI